MDEREIQGIRELLSHFAAGLGAGAGPNISEELRKMKETLEDEILTMPSKDPAHIFADAEIAGMEHLKGVIVELSGERKRFQAKVRELAAVTRRYNQLKIRYEEMGVLLAVDEEEQARQKENSKERDQLRICVNIIRGELDSVPKDSVKAKLEEFVSCAREAISKIPS